MGDISYQQARRLGLKEVKARTAKHEEPCLAVLEELLPHLSSLSEVRLGTFRVDIEQVAGTRTSSRRDAFSASFYPLLDENSEFAAKWSALAASHLKEGIREPIVALEYLNRYYVVEGHKRVSVLRYFGAATVRAEVRRILPARSDEPEVEAYFEFLEFNKITGVNYIRFDAPGRYPALQELLCGGDPTPWDEDRQRCPYSDVFRFRRVFRASELNGKLTQDEALLRYLQVFGYPLLQTRTPNELKTDLAAIAPELSGPGSESAPVLMTDPEAQPRSILKRIVHLPARSLKAAFLHDKSPGDSFWTMAHEKGRLEAQAALGERVETRSYFNMRQENFAERIQALAEEDCAVIFSTSPMLLASTLTAAGAYPNIKFLNCALNVNHPILRCYYGRMYEAKYLTGVIAGSMSENGRVGYVCNYPIYGMLASVNAFALGARTVDPRAQVYLQWSTVPGVDIDAYFAANEVRVISGRSGESIVDRVHGSDLVLTKNGLPRNLASAYWDWGNFYRKILESVMDGSWASPGGASEQGQSINYWWGISGGVVDVYCRPDLPSGTRRLTELLRQKIADGSFRPFAGPVYDQAGKLRIATDEILAPEQLLLMDWLTEGVIGELPDMDRLTKEAQELVKLQGVLKKETEK